MKEFIKRNKEDLIIYFGYLGVLVTLIFFAVFFQNQTPYSPYMLDLGKVQVAWYAVFILSGILLAATMAYREFKRLNWDVNDLFDGILIIAPLAIIGARLYYVIFDPIKENYKTILDVIAIWEGGLAIHGAIIVAAIGVVIYSNKKKLNKWALADILAIGLLMGQIAGRWGNFMNAEAHGPQTNNSFLINILPNFISNQMAYSGSSKLPTGYIYHPTFLYESLWNLVGLTIFMILRRKRVLKTGNTFALYLIWYGLGRGLLIEPLRTDQLLVFGIPVNILLSLVLFVGGGIALILVKRKLIEKEEYYYDLLDKKEVQLEND